MTSVGHENARAESRPPLEHARHMVFLARVLERTQPMARACSSLLESPWQLEPVCLARVDSSMLEHKLYH